MTKHTLTAVAIALSSLAVAGTQHETQVVDQGFSSISQGFERMLGHEPYHGATAGTAQMRDDPLTSHVHAALRGGSMTAMLVAASGADSRYWINVTQSFQRMFEHQPYAGPTATVAVTARDPMEVAFHAMLNANTEVVRVAASGATRVE